MLMPRTRRFVEEHLLVSSVTFAVVMSSLALVIALAVTNDIFGLIKVESADAVGEEKTEAILPTDLQAIGVGDADCLRTMDRADMNSALRDSGTQAVTGNAGEIAVPRKMDHADMISTHSASSSQASYGQCCCLGHIGR